MQKRPICTQKRPISMQSRSLHTRPINMPKRSILSIRRRIYICREGFTCRTDLYRRNLRACNRSTGETELTFMQKRSRYMQKRPKHKRRIYMQQRLIQKRSTYMQQEVQEKLTFMQKETYIHAVSVGPGLIGYITKTRIYMHKRPIYMQKRPILKRMVFMQ